MTRTTNPAAQLLTLAGSYMVALKVIRLLTTEQEGQHTLPPEQLIEQIREIATAPLEHRKPHLSEQTLAYLARQQDLAIPPLDHLTESVLQESGDSSQQASVSIQIEREFTTEERAWGCFLTNMDTASFTVHFLRRVTKETEALAQALRLAPNRRGDLFSPKRGTRLLTLVCALPQEERSRYIDLAQARLMKYTQTELGRNPDGKPGEGGDGVLFT